MAENQILVPVKRNLEGKEFYSDRKDKALKACQDESFEAQFMPSIIDTRIEAEKDARIWQTWWDALSVKATGRGKSTNISHKGGTKFVVYAHRPNYFSNFDNIETAINQGLITGQTT